MVKRDIRLADAMTQDPGRAVVIAVVFALLALDVGVDGIRDELVGAAGNW